MDRQIGVGTFQTSDRARQLVNQVLDSNRLSYGPLSLEFEQRFAEMHGCEFGVLSNSGTSSLLVALQTLKELHGWKDGDEVITSALTFVATVNVILQAGLKPVLIDVDSKYYDLNPYYSPDAMFTSQLRRSINNRTRAIIPVHTFGQPANMMDIRAIAQSANLAIIEDSCESMLVRHCTKPVGSWGDIGVFSFYAAHLLVTGVGGMSITNNSDYARVMRSYVNHGIDLTELPNGEEYDPTWLARKFCFVRIGHSFRITEMESALGLAQLDDLPAIIRKRQENAAYLILGLSLFGEQLQLPAIRPNTEHSWMMFPLICRQEGIRDNLISHLERNGIGTRLMLPLVNQPCYKGLWKPDEFPVAKWIDQNGFYIASHQHLTREDLDFIVEKIGEFFDGR